MSACLCNSSKMTSKLDPYQCFTEERRFPTARALSANELTIVGVVGGVTDYNMIGGVMPACLCNSSRMT